MEVSGVNHFSDLNNSPNNLEKERHSLMKKISFPEGEVRRIIWKCYGPYLPLKPIKKAS
jgi:hypothetical protein